jgi:hypothetical protein
MKKLTIILAILTLFSCSNLSKDERVKSAKSGAASDRINNTQSNTDKVFDELD